MQGEYDNRLHFHETSGKQYDTIVVYDPCRLLVIMPSCLGGLSG